MRSSISLLLSSGFPSTVTSSLAWTLKALCLCRRLGKNMADLPSSDNSSCRILHLCASFHFRRPHIFLHSTQNFPSASGRLMLLFGEQSVQTAQRGDMIRKEILINPPMKCHQNFPTIAGKQLCFLSMPGKAGVTSRGLPSQHHHVLGACLTGSLMCWNKLENQGWLESHQPLGMGNLSTGTAAQLFPLLWQRTLNSKQKKTPQLSFKY